MRQILSFVGVRVARVVKKGKHGAYEMSARRRVRNPIGTQEPLRRLFAGTTLEGYVEASRCKTLNEFMEGENDAE